MESKGCGVLDTRLRGYDELLWSSACASSSRPPSRHDVERALPRHQSLRNTIEAIQPVISAMKAVARP